MALSILPNISFLPHFRKMLCELFLSYSTTFLQNNQLYYLSQPKISFIKNVFNSFSYYCFFDLFGIYKHLKIHTSSVSRIVTLMSPNKLPLFHNKCASLQSWEFPALEAYSICHNDEAEWERKCQASLASFPRKRWVYCSVATQCRTIRCNRESIQSRNSVYYCQNHFI